jgi:hypothetical protein
MKEYEADVKRAIYNEFEKIFEEADEYGGIRFESKRLTDEMIEAVK